MTKKISYFSRSRLAGPCKTEILSPLVSTYELKKTVKVIDKDNDIYEIIDELVEVNRIDTQALTDGYQGQTGTSALIKRVGLTGDTSLLDLKEYSEEQPITDASSIPSTLGEALKISKRVGVYESLDPALTKGRQVDDFIANFTQAELDAYIEERVKKLTEKKQGGSTNE